MLTVQGRKENERSAPIQNLANLTTKVGKNVNEPLKDSMHALMRLFLWSPDDDEANAGGVSIIIPAARPIDTRNEIHRFVISSSEAFCVGHPALACFLGEKV